ncbi:MAG: hypothetical protein AAGI01_01370 [Myxococcota bacterium]
MNSIDELSEVVSPAILQRAAQVSRLLAELGVPHALIGGLAVGVHGYPRATKDVDFLVGTEAFEKTAPFAVFREELREIVRASETDMMATPEKYPALAAELRLEENLPVVSLRGLVLMKLDASRARDREDVRVLVASNPERQREVLAYLREHAPELIHRFAEALASS